MQLWVEILRVECIGWKIKMHDGSPFKSSSTSCGAEGAVKSG